MILETYQSKLVWKILKSGETYRAKPNLGLKGEYAALIDMLGLQCECPVFAVIKGRRQNTGGKVSGAVKLTLDVPDKYIYLTEYEVWADFLYAFRYSMPNNYKTLRPDCEEITGREYAALIENLKEQRPAATYKTPQVVLEKIEPGWVKSARPTGKGGFLAKLFGR